MPRRVALFRNAENVHTISTASFRGIESLIRGADDRRRGFELRPESGNADTHRERPVRLRLAVHKLGALNPAANALGDDTRLADARLW